MSKTEAKTPVDLETMLGDGFNFEAQNKKYTILPVKIREILELKNDNLSLREDQQGFNIVIDKNKGLLDKWLKQKLLDGKKEPMSLEKISVDDWDTDDLSEFLRKLYKISG